MNRKNFLRNTLMAIAISVCPKSLLPSFGDVEEEGSLFDNEKINERLCELKNGFVVSRQFWWAEYNPETKRYIQYTTIGNEPNAERIYYST